MSRSPRWTPTLRRQMQVFLKQIQRRIAHDLRLCHP